ncbi:hypothetical protein [Rhizorhapis sp.]|uniref:hypothetical protein n=1 Tax=Rhizorhapis sp. TaxID=1968842 RepID=UPI002B4826EC|nr:hypothetical protein [Rhizorhapis sp.]HKR16426.1 hypothetical protein [Rhizorhapis sp.]
MATVDGAYDCITKTPMGDQPSVFTVISNGDSFHGTNAGPLGSLDVKEGKVDGNKLRWKMEMVVPMPMTLDAEAVVEGDTLTGTIQAGAFGAMAMTGKRRS